MTLNRGLYDNKKSRAVLRLSETLNVWKPVKMNPLSRGKPVENSPKSDESN